MSGGTSAPSVDPSRVALQYLGTAHRASGEGWALFGQDGGQSIELGDRHLFVFADTLLAEELTAHGQAVLPERLEPQQGLFLGNCAALSSGTTLQEALADLDYLGNEQGRPQEILPADGLERMMGVRFWPQHGAEVAGTVYLFYLGIQHLDPGTWGIRAIGNGLATLDLETGRCCRISIDGEWCHWPSLEDDLRFGVQVLVESDTAYIFGSRDRGGSSRASVARVETCRMAEPAAYEHLTSNPHPHATPEWRSRPAEDFDLGPCGGDYSVSYNAFLNGYLMVFVDGFDKQLCLRLAERPWGPYGEIVRVPDRLPHHQRSGLISLGFEHSGFQELGGRALSVSYCQPHFLQNSLLRVVLSPETGSIR